MQLFLLTITLLPLFLLATPAPDKARHHRNKNNIAPTTTSTSTNTAAPPPPPPPSSTPCPAKVFDVPWILTDLTIFTPAGQQDNTTSASTSTSTSTHGTISFHFADKNARLQLATDCSGTVIDGYCGGSDGGYVLCENSNIAFKLDSGMIMLERAYLDDCLGPWPYNSGVAFGQNQTMLEVVQQVEGTMAMQERLLVEITAMD